MSYKKDIYYKFIFFYVLLANLVMVFLLICHFFNRSDYGLL